MASTIISCQGHALSRNSSTGRVGLTPSRDQGEATHWILTEDGTIVHAPTGELLTVRAGKPVREEARARLETVQPDGGEPELGSLWAVTPTPQSGTVTISSLLNTDLVLDIYDPVSPKLKWWVPHTGAANQKWSLLSADQEDHGEDSEEEEDEKKAMTAPTRRLNVYSLNCAYNNYKQNLKKIVKHIADHQYDVVCLQEVNPYLVRKVVNHLGGGYHIIEGTHARIRHDTMMLVRKTAVANGEIQLQRYVLARNKNRSVMYATFRWSQCPDTVIVCTTAHLESKFFTDAALSYKRAQLAQIGELLQQGSATHDRAIAFHVGDTNLTGGDDLVAENEAIDRAGLYDLFTWTETTWDPAERQETTVWKQHHATWRSPENPLTAELGPGYSEYHRPDRFFVTAPVASLIDVGQSTVTIQKEGLSDHDGLVTNLAVPC